MLLDFKNIKPICKPFFFLAAIALLQFGVTLHGDEYHYKNVLVGDRAATLGGAYVAISDDASGSFYNPAGMAFSFGESVSGSGNAYHTSNTQYKDAIGDADWNRDSTAVLPSFFGLTQKSGDLTWAISYIVPDSIIEHQDQSYTVDNATVNKYYLSLHSEDETNLIGPSFAYQVSDTLSLGFSLFYATRIYRHQQNEFIAYKDGSNDSDYESVKIDEHFFLPIFGLQYSPFDPVFIGLTISKGILQAKNIYRDSNSLDSNSFNLTNTIETEEKQYPTHVALGAAAYPTPSLLIAFDMDVYLAGDEDLENILNLSLGAEYFWNADHAFRLGYFTNNDSRSDCSSSGCNQAKIDSTGFTLGYSSYTRTSGFTIGAIFSKGTGNADVYGDQSVIVDVERQSTTLIFAANYNY